MDTNNNKKVWIGVAVAAVVLIGGWMLMRAKNVAAPVGEIPSESSIMVADQDTNTVGVTITSAKLAVAGFIEIHADANGAPGAYVGSSKVLAAGTYANQSIIMSTTPGSYYWAMLHADDGNGIFEAAKDLPMMKGGEPIMTKFQVKPAGIGAEVEIKG